MSVKAGKVWRELGALAYVECVGDDLDMKVGVPFTRLPNIKKGETVVFSWILYKSKADRKRINAKVMKDPRIVCDPDSKAMPFDIARMCFSSSRRSSTSELDGRGESQA